MRVRSSGREKTDQIRDALGTAARETLKNVGGRTPTKSKAGPLTGAKGIAAGVGLAAAAPLARKGVGVVRAGRLARKPAKVAEKAATKAGDRAYLSFLAESPLVFPTDDMLANLQSYKVLSEEEEQSWGNAFTEVLSG